jgi:capsular exopolysaccharide family
VNLAKIFAINNKKVLLIGCDLRRPELHKIFNTKNTAGVSSIIIGKNTVEESVLSTSIQGLWLLPAGPPPPNPAELLEAKKVEQMLIRLKKEYDYIILDTSPIALVSDSLSLAQYVDMTIYVIRQNYSKKEVVDIANQMRINDRLPNMGLLINDIESSRSMGYNYYYGYSNNYNYGYYDYSGYYTDDDSGG